MASMSERIWEGECPHELDDERCASQRADERSKSCWDAHLGVRGCARARELCRMSRFWSVFH